MRLAADKDEQRVPLGGIDAWKLAHQQRGTGQALTQGLLGVELDDVLVWQPGDERHAVGTQGVTAQATWCVSRQPLLLHDQLTVFDIR